eukprot:jgi/Botrbrau1/16502/Bobra.0142s0096.1
MSTPADRFSLDPRWDRAIDVTLRRIFYGSLGGAIVAFTLFRSPAGRFGTVMFGAGFGAGAAYVEAQELFRKSVLVTPEKPPPQALH